MAVKCVLRGRDKGRVDHGAASALIAHIGKERTGNVQFFRSGKREYAVIFQQHRAIGSDLSRKLMMHFPVRGTRFGRFHVTVDPAKNVPAGFVQIFHRKRAVCHAVQDLTAAVRRIAGHFEIQPRTHTLYAVMRSAPVGHDHAVKAPLGTEHVCEKPFVLRAEGSVDLIIGAHQRGRFRVLHDVFEGFQIDRADRLLGSDRIAHHAVVFRVVQRKMLHGNAHALGLDALDFRRAHDTRKVGILGKVLEVPAAERISLDVDARTQKRMHAVMTALSGDRSAHFPGILRIPAGCGRRRGGK